MDLALFVIEDVLVAAAIDVVPLTSCVREIVCNYPTCGRTYDISICIRNDEETCCCIKCDVLCCRDIPNDLLANFSVEISCSLILTG